MTDTPQTAHDDIALIRRIAAGDRSAENDLFVKFDEAIRRFVRLKSGMRNESEDDIVSEAKVAILLSLRAGKYDPAKGVSVGSYIYGITRHKVLDHFRRRSNIDHRNTSLDSVDIAVEPEESELDREQRATQLRDAIMRLKPKYKEALYLRYYRELSVAEISKLLDIDPRRVSERIHYAIKLLQKTCKRSDFFSILALLW